MAVNIRLSDRAVLMSVFGVRPFIEIRTALLESRELRQELDKLRRQTNGRFQVVFETLDHLLTVEDKSKRTIGFTAEEKQAACAVKPQA